MKSLVFIACLLLSGPAFAQGLSKDQLASRFYDLTTAKLLEGQAQAAAAKVLEKDRTKVRQAEIYKQWARDTFGSVEYKDIYVTYYVETFTREELVAMNEWAQNPLFVGYMTKVGNFPQWSAPRFEQYLAVRKQDLARRFREAGVEP